MENANHHTLLLHRIGKATCGTPGNKSSGSSVSTVTVNRGWVPRYMNAEYTDGSGPQSVIKLADYVSRERGQGGRSIILNANLRDLKRADTHSTPQYVFMTCWSASTLRTHAHTHTHVYGYSHQPHQFGDDSCYQKTLLPPGVLQRNVWMQPLSALRPTNCRWKARHYCISFVGWILEIAKRRHVWSHPQKKTNIYFPRSLEILTHRHRPYTFTITMTNENHGRPLFTLVGISPVQGKREPLSGLAQHNGQSYQHCGENGTRNNGKKVAKCVGVGFCAATILETWVQNKTWLVSKNGDNYEESNSTTYWSSGVYR